MNREQLIERYSIDWSQERIDDFRQRLLDWYDQEGRDLPWRLSQDPYHVWVSEIMLQQTQVSTVIPYYERFISQLPTIQDLAMTDEPTLMSLWQGLGYYSRARNLQVAAQQIVTEYGGEMPKTMPELLSLKGIGPYTAAAIGSICFDLVEPALDGNLIRIITRLFEIKDDVTLTATRQRMMAILYQLIDPNRPGDFNQALMDLGATIMTPVNPNPVDSPILDYDLSYQHGTVLDYPVKKKRTKVTDHHFIAYAIRNHKGEWLMRRHQTDELLAGLWHFPLVEMNLVMEEATADELWHPLIEAYGSDIELTEASPKFHQYGSYLTPVKHVFSHRRWYVQVVSLTLDKEISMISEDWSWVPVQSLDTLAKSSLQVKLFKALDALGELDDVL